MISTILQLQATLLGPASEVQTLDLAEVVLDLKQSSPPNSGYGVTGSSRFRHSPRAARSCRSSCGHPGRPGRSGTAGTPASASVSGHGCSALVGYCVRGGGRQRRGRGRRMSFASQWPGFISAAQKWSGLFHGLIECAVDTGEKQARYVQTR